MTDYETKPVVVGIDGSPVAVATARWALVEASAREVPLRLLYSVNTARTVGDQGRIEGREAELGETALRTAATALAEVGQSVKIETDLTWGPPSSALIAESHNAAIVCVGTIGIGAVARAVLGSTAARVAEHAHCPVAVIRPRADQDGRAENWIAVGIEPRPEPDIAAKLAFEEARMRHAPLLAVALGCNEFRVNTVDDTAHRLALWRSLYPDVTVDIVSAQAGLADYLADYLADSREELSRLYTATPGRHDFARTSPLAVVSNGGAAEVMRIVGPHGPAVLGHAQCSVLVAR